MISKKIIYSKVSGKSEVKKFIYESFIFENVFGLKSNKTIYSGTLLQINEDNTLLLRFPDDIRSFFKINNLYELYFNNSRGKFKTESSIKNIAFKGGRTYVILFFPKYLNRLQRRRSIRVIPEYLKNPLTISFLIKGENSTFTIRDIGLNGFSLTLNKDNILSNLRVGEIINTEINLPNSKWPIKCKAKIVHGSVILSKYRAGFEFLEVDSKFKDILTDYILIRRTEIKIKILKKDGKREIAKISIGEWLESIIEYKKEKFVNFKITILSNREKDIYNIILNHFPSTSFLKLEEYEQLKNKHSNLIILHLDSNNKNVWYKISKVPEIKNTPLIILYKDGSILHFVKDKPFFTKIVNEKELEKNIIREILLYSNITIQPVDFSILKEKPLYDGNNKKVLIIDNTAFNFSMYTLLNNINFNAEISENFPGIEALNNYDLIVYNPKSSLKEELEIIFSILEKRKCILLTFNRTLSYSEQLSNLFDEKNIIVKPFKYDTFINKVLFLADEEDVNTYFKPIKIPVITSNMEKFSQLIEKTLQNSIYDNLFDFQIIDGENLDINEIKKKDVLIDIHTSQIDRYPLTIFIKEFSLKYKTKFYGIVYQNIAKQLLVNCIKAGVINIFTINQLKEKLKEYIISSLLKEYHQDK